MENLSERQHGSPLQPPDATAPDATAPETPAPKTTAQPHPRTDETAPPLPPTTHENCDSTHAPRAQGCESLLHPPAPLSDTLRNSLRIVTESMSANPQTHYFELPARDRRQLENHAALHLQHARISDDFLLPLYGGTATFRGGYLAMLSTPERASVAVRKAALTAIIALSFTAVDVVSDSSYEIGTEPRIDGVGYGALLAQATKIIGDDAPMAIVKILCALATSPENTSLTELLQPDAPLFELTERAQDVVDAGLLIFPAPALIQVTALHILEKVRSSAISPECASTIDVAVAPLIETPFGTLDLRTGFETNVTAEATKVLANRSSDLDSNSAHLLINILQDRTRPILIRAAAAQSLENCPSAISAAIRVLNEPISWRERTTDQALALMGRYVPDAAALQRERAALRRQLQNSCFEITHPAPKGR